MALAIAISILAVLLSRQRLQRHRVFRVAPAERRARPAQTIPPIDQWTASFETLAPEDLAELLEQIAKAQPDIYARYSLGYLHARALLEENDLNDAAEKLRPFLQAGHPLRVLAVYHQAEIDEALNDHTAASRWRQELIFSNAPVYRDQAIDDEADYLSSMPDPAPLIAFVRKLTPSLDSTTRREMNGRVAESLIRAGNSSAAFATAITLLNAGTMDDASDRVSRVLDRPEFLGDMNPGQKVMLAETLRNHRHFDRAAALMTSVLSSGVPFPPAKRDEMQFALGRSYFGDEKYAAALQVYMRGANSTVDPKMKSTFLFHASRATQLSGDDTGAERLMTASLAVKGKFPSTTAALTQRLRTRAKQRRLGEAASDLQLLKKVAGNEHAYVDGALAYALGTLGAGNAGAALSALNSVPPKLLDKYDATEFAYWRARAAESADAKTAFTSYLQVLRASVPTHFAYFSRERLDAPPMNARITQEIALRAAQVQNLVNSKQFALAKSLQTDRILLSSSNHAAELSRLAGIYREIPAYKTILELTPEPLPQFPLPPDPDRTTLLMALGLYDEVVDEVRHRYPLRTPRSALTQAIALNRGNASRESIYAVEVLMKSVPADFHPDLLPKTVRQLLYPRYFFSYISEDARKYGADPTLVLSIMREESRFNPRAKSEAAARGLLQFIITTAREIGRNVGLVDVAPDDLYDPRVIITLGAKYVSELSKSLDNNHYRVAAAYNAGPKQVALWSRLAPATGDDWFLSSINFDETKHYVRKVMNSYRRYEEIYGNGAPQGGMRIEP